MNEKYFSVGHGEAGGEFCQSYSQVVDLFTQLLPMVKAAIPVGILSQ